MEQYLSKDYEGTVMPKTITEHDRFNRTIDMGLSVKWASCNLGASTPAGPGQYFAWGEVAPKTIYNWQTYKWSGSSYNTLDKYNPRVEFGKTDWRKALDISDDAANKMLGGKWRIPTAEEWDELFRNCDICPASLSVKGKMGLALGNMFVSKRNGNAIFIPLSGMKYDDRLGDVLKFGFYWSASLDVDNPDRAWSADMDWDVTMMVAIMRYRGYAIRPVKDY